MSGKKRTSTAKSATADIGRSAAERDALQSLDDVAVSHALHRGELDIVVRYLREVITPLIQRRQRRVPGRFGSTATIGLLADMLEGRESTPWHLKRVLARRGAPSDVAGTALKNIRIGARIAAHSQSGEFIGPLRPSDPQPVLKNAIADICAEFGITPAHAHKCFALFQKYRFHNERDEPMPIPERSRRRRTKRAT
jgi:hypothetical protein